MHTSDSMVDDSKPTRQIQCNLSLAIMEVVKIKVLKFFDVGIIYPITDNKWVSPTQVVLKKSKITVIWNDDGELVPTCTATS